jgi:hypothetical protein
MPVAGQLCYEGKRQLGIFMHRWEDNIKKELRKLGFRTVGWVIWVTTEIGGALL